MRRRRRDDGPACEAGEATTLYAGTDYERVHHNPCWRITCATCEPILGAEQTPPGGGGFRPHRTFLGSPRMPYAKWAASATLYTWPLWRNWTAPKRLRVETPAEVLARQLSTTPAGYTWRLWWQHPAAPGERVRRAA